MDVAEIKAITTGNPLLLEKMTLDNEVVRLKILRGSWSNENLRLQRAINDQLPDEIKRCERRDEILSADIATVKANKTTDFSIKIEGRTFTERPDAGDALMAVISAKCNIYDERVNIGEYRGLTLAAERYNNGLNADIRLYLLGKGQHRTKAGESALGNITRIENLAEKLTENLTENKSRLEKAKSELEQAKSLADKPFEFEEKLAECVARQIEINTKLEFMDLEKQKAGVGNEDIEAENEEFENENENDCGQEDNIEVEI